MKSRRLPDRRGLHPASVGGHKVYLRTGEYERRLGEFSSICIKKVQLSARWFTRHRGIHWPSVWRSLEEYAEETHLYPL